MNLFESSTPHRKPEQIELRPACIEPPACAWVLLSSYLLEKKRIELYVCEMYTYRCYKHISGDDVSYSCDADRKLRTDDLGQIASACKFKKK